MIHWVYMKPCLSKTICLYLQHKAFSLVEFVVIISIFSIMAGVVIFNFNGFRNSVALDNLTHDIALSIRQAQVQGSSGDIRQGIVFRYDISNPPATYQPTFTVFSDDNNNNAFDDGNSITPDTIRDEIKIQYQEFISGIEVVDEFDFGPVITPITSDAIILFQRPWLEALFYDTARGRLFNDKMRIKVSTIDSSGVITTRNIVISRSGQIAIE